MTVCQLELFFFCTVIFNQDTQKNASRKCIWKCRQRNVSHLLVLNALNIISLINYKTATILNYIIWKQIHQHLGTCCPGLCISRRGHLNCDKFTVEMTSCWDAKSPKDVFGGLDSSLGKHRVLAGLLLHMQLQLVTSMSQSLKDYQSFSCELKFKLRKYQTIFITGLGSSTFKVLESSTSIFSYLQVQVQVQVLRVLGRHQVHQVLFQSSTSQIQVLW